MPSSYPRPHAMVQQLYERASEYLLRSYPLKDLPLRLRPAIVFVVAAWLILLGVLGLAPLPTLPINDKALHFFGLGFATFLIYFVLEVPEGPHRRVWYIRRAPLLLTLATSFLVGGVISEFIQATLPWKEFQFGDIVANLLGSSLFLYLAHLLHQRNRRRQELSELYQPISAHSSSVYRDAQGRTHPFNHSASGPGSGSGLGSGANGQDGTAERVGLVERDNVWDDEVDEPRQSFDNSVNNSNRRTGSVHPASNASVNVNANAVFAIGDDEHGDNLV